ncbi:hypothetical protein BRADI_1g00438v3 [Brachypodium distachyon]|uniref:GRF-type domain-containing protein n=1 Tax=Brachypodium distachyon TaxID=15368 RepID=A0A2K2DHI5_BRADI|nr:hypothetical protein BRADI_1g00438v3 [Brachypodium distachyon]
MCPFCARARVITFIADTAANRDRRFYKCPHHSDIKGTRGDCDFYKWEDEYGLFLASLFGASVVPGGASIGLDSSFFRVVASDLKKIESDIAKLLALVLPVLVIQICSKMGPLRQV